MANNVLERLAQMSTPDIKRANWNLDYTNAGTNDFGFLKVKFCEMINANTKVKLDFRSAYCSNPTISPVFSKAKVRVTAIWVPISLYVPALRDNAAIKPGETDFLFPTVNFRWDNLQREYSTSGTDTNVLNYDATPMSAMGSSLASKIFSYYYGASYYVPHGSLMAELGMYKPDYLSQVFVTNLPSQQYPTPKNAIPLLGYLDFYRTYVANSQDDNIPIRTRSFVPAIKVNVVNENNVTSTLQLDARPAEDTYVTRSMIDNVFSLLRQNGSTYPTAQGSLVFDISGILSVNLVEPFPTLTAHNLRQYIENNTNQTIKDYLKYNPPLFISDNHYMELRDTYAGDYFKAFLSNENVEYERSTARVVADDGGVITMEQIFAAQRVQNYIRRSVFKNNGYADFIESQYDITPPTTLSHPMFLGSISSDIYWNDVVSQTQSGEDNTIESNKNLGSRAAIGYGRLMTGKYRNNDDRPFVSFTAKEPGYLMLIESIVPDISYFQTYDVNYDKTSLEDLYFPAFDKDGYQDKHFAALVEQPDFIGREIQRYVFSDYNTAYAQEPAYFEFMAKYNKITGQMVDPGVYRHWVFTPQGAVDSSYQSGEISLSEFRRQATSTYVDPEPFNKIFANTNGLDNFQTFYDFDFKVYQPLSHRFLSFK